MPTCPAELIRQAYADALEDEPQLGDAFRADIVAVFDRDPATDRFIEPVLYYKGFHAIQTHRLAHWLWSKGRKDFAYYLQSRSSAVFQCDIHPAAKVGRGIFLDHATGLVVGETAMIGDNVSMLHDVTLGGTGKDHGDRHPKIGDGVLIGAGARIIGNIEVGRCARIAAGSVVLKAVPNNVTVAGVPAKVVGDAVRGAVAHHGPDVPWIIGRAVWYPGRPRRERGRRAERAGGRYRSQKARRLSAASCSATRASAWCPKKGDTAEVFIGEDDLGELTVDDEDGDRSYNFRMVIQVSSDPSFSRSRR